MKLRIATLAGLAVLASLSVVLGYQAFGVERAGDETKKPPQAKLTAGRETAKAVAERDTPRIIATLSEIGEVVEPDDILEIQVGQMCLLSFKEAPRRFNLEEGIQRPAPSQIISSTQVVVGGARPGSTTWYVWFEEPSKAKREQLLSLRVRVVRKRELPAEKQADSKSSARYDRKDIRPQETIKLKESEARLVLLKQKPKRAFIVDTNIATTGGDLSKLLSLFGNIRGETAMILWFPDEEDKIKEKMFPALIQVSP